jgi:acetylornithine deacetylase
VTLEQRILEGVAAGREELIELTSALIGFDTTARDIDDPPRDEADLQAYLGDRLGAAGAAVDIWEPDPGDVSGSRQIPAGLRFEGRPQLVARVGGAGGGRSLLLNGHIDVVPSEPRTRWTSDPNRAEVRGGNLYGRGACDMKGGVACMVYATEVLARLGVQLQGDLVVNTVTDEESSGAGGLASVRHGVRADAGIVPEPTAFAVWVACRGSLTPTVTVEGRPGHAEMAQPHWRDGGAVNAIEKMDFVLRAVERLRQEWDGRPDKLHPHLSCGTIVPVKISGGEWTVTYPAACALTCEVMYLPQNADADGWGRKVQAEIERWIAAAAEGDPWLREHPPVVEWALDIPPAEVDPAHPIVDAVVRASLAAGEPAALGGLDSWFDAATFTRFAATPSIGFGPRSLAWGHTIDEYVPVDDLVSCTQALALAAADYCGVAA